jgi:hypothetical protein
MGSERFDVLQSDTWDAAIGAAYMIEREDLTDDDTGAAGYNRADLFLSVLGRLGEHVRLDMFGFYLPILSVAQYRASVPLLTGPAAPSFLRYAPCRLTVTTRSACSDRERRGRRNAR